MAKKLSFCWYLVLILVIVSAGMYLWGYFKVKEMEKTVKEKEMVMVERAQLMVNENAQNLLKATALPLVWAIRKEMIRGNFEQINEYMERLVQEKGFKTILLVDASLKILLSTDKSMQGHRFADYYPVEILQVNDISISADSFNIRVIAPVMGLDSRLGTLVIEYQLENISL